jgi:hypothetical protein
MGELAAGGGAAGRLLGLVEPSALLRVGVRGAAAASAAARLRTAPA